MSHVNLIWKTKAQILWNNLSLLVRTAKLRLLLIVFLAVLFWLAGFKVFYQGFLYMEMTPFIDITGEKRVISLFFMMLLGLLVFTSMLAAYSVFYESSDTRFLMSFPVSPRSIFFAKFVESLGYCAVALFFLGVPLMVSYGMVHHVQWYFYASLGAFFLPLILLPCALGVCLAAMLVRLFPRLDFKWLVLAACLMSSVWLVYLFQAFNLMEMNRHVSWWYQPKPPTSQEIILSPHWPNYWITEGLMAAGRGRLDICLRNVLRLFGLMSAVLIPTLIFLPSVFHKGFFQYISSGVSRQFPPGSGLVGKLAPLFSALKAPMKSLIFKDLRLFWRDSTQWVQFLLFYGFLLIYIMSIRSTPILAESLVWKDRIALLNLFATALVMTALTSRFVFPMLSQEGRRFWVVGMAPISAGSVLWVKFWLSFAISIVFTGGLVVLSSIVLKVSLLVYGVSLVTIVLINLSLVGMATGLGAVYTNLDDGNTVRLASGTGGALTFFLSVCYVILAVSALAGPFFLRAERWLLSPSRFHLTLAAVMTFNIVLSLVAAAVPMVFGLRSLRRLELT